LATKDKTRKKQKRIDY